MAEEQDGLFYNINYGEVSWKCKINVIEVTKNNEYIAIKIIAQRGKNFLLTINILPNNSLVIAIPLLEISFLIQDLTDGDYLYMKLKEKNINDIDSNNILGAINRVLDEVGIGSDEEN